MAIDERDNLIEAQIRAARERGDFDDLPGHGKPLELDDLAGLSAEQRFEALLMRSTRELTPELSLIREIRSCRKLIGKAESPEERERNYATLQSKIAELSAALKARKA